MFVFPRNHLLRLDSHSLQQLELIPWMPDDIKVKICQAKGQSSQKCQNFIRVLMLKDDSIFVCGTNAFSPKCSWRPVCDTDNINFVNCVLNPIIFFYHFNGYFLTHFKSEYLSWTVLKLTNDQM